MKSCTNGDRVPGVVDALLPLPVPALVAEAARQDWEEEEKEQSCNAACHCMGLHRVSMERVWETKFEPCKCLMLLPWLALGRGGEGLRNDTASPPVRSGSSRKENSSAWSKIR